MAWARWDNQDWTSYTPVLTASTTNPGYGTSPVRWGMYHRVGKLVTAHFRIIFGSSPSAGSGTYYINFPVTAKAGLEVHCIGTVFLYDNNVGNAAIALPIYIDQNKFAFDYGYNGAYGFVQAGTPWAWAASDQIHGFVNYEAA